MNAIVLLRAIGGAAVPVAAPVDIPRQDPFETAILRRFQAAGLWRFGATLEVVNAPPRVQARVFLTEFAQADRETGRQEANIMKDALRLALQLQGVRAVFTDSLWSERGAKGWVVIGRGQVSTEGDAP